MTLPDLISPNLDVLIVGINPSLDAAYSQHYYAGPCNHFWKCMAMAGIVPPGTQWAVLGGQVGGSLLYKNC